jgi:hypothetical protein
MFDRQPIALIEHDGLELGAGKVICRSTTCTPRGVYLPEVQVLTEKQYQLHSGSSFELKEVTT